VYGVVLAVILLGLPYFALNYLLPGYEDTIQARIDVARVEIDSATKLRDQADAADRLYQARYAAPYAAASNLPLMRGVELQDHLGAAALLRRIYGTVRLNVLRSANERDRDPLLSFLYPSWRFERFKLDLEGTLPDVLDFLRREIEVYPMATYTEFSVSSSTSRGSFPRYTVEVWMPVRSDTAQAPARRIN
jgi:hypothetical protein